MSSRSTLSVAIVICGFLAALSIGRLIADGWSISGTASETAQLDKATRRLQDELSEFRASLSATREVTTTANPQRLHTEAPVRSGLRLSHNVGATAEHSAVAGTAAVPSVPPVVHELPSSVTESRTRVETSRRTVSDQGPIVYAPVTVTVDNGPLLTELAALRTRIDDLASTQQVLQQQPVPQAVTVLNATPDVSSSMVAFVAESTFDITRSPMRLKTIPPAVVEQVPVATVRPEPMIDVVAPARLTPAIPEAMLQVGSREAEPITQLVQPPIPVEFVVMDFAEIAEPEIQQPLQISPDAVPLAHVPPAFDVDRDIAEFDMEFTVQSDRTETNVSDVTLSDPTSERVAASAEIIQTAAVEITEPQDLFANVFDVKTVVGADKPEIAQPWQAPITVALPLEQLAGSNLGSLPATVDLTTHRNFADPFAVSSLASTVQHSPNDEPTAETSNGFGFSRPQWVANLVDRTEHGTNRLTTATESLLDRATHRNSSPQSRSAHRKSMTSSGKPNYAAFMPQQAPKAPLRQKQTVSPSATSTTCPDCDRGPLATTAPRRTSVTSPTESNRVLHRISSTVRFAASPKSLQ